MKYLNKKVVLITGASRGIGAATAILLAANGARVAINYLSKKPEAEEVVQKINKEGGVAMAVQADVTKAEDVERAVLEIKNKFGMIDILINNATAPIIFPEDYKLVGDSEWNQYYKHLEVQIHGTYNAAKTVLQDMKSQKSGAIINVLTSYVTGRPPTHLGGYVVAKYGLLGLTNVLKAEYNKYGIYVGAVFPEFTDTDLTRHLPRIYKEMAVKESKNGKLGVPEDAAKEILSIILDNKC